MEDVRASGEEARGELCPANFRESAHHEKRKDPPARRVAWSDNVFKSSWRELGSSCNCRSTECDLAESRLSEMLSLGGPFSGGAVPIKPLRVGAEDFGGV